MLGRLRVRHLLVLLEIRRVSVRVRVVVYDQPGGVQLSLHEVLLLHLVRVRHRSE